MGPHASNGCVMFQSGIRSGSDFIWVPFIWLSLCSLVFFELFFFKGEKLLVLFKEEGIWNLNFFPSVFVS